MHDNGECSTTIVALFKMDLWLKLIDLVHRFVATQC